MTVISQQTQEFRLRRSIALARMWYGYGNRMRDPAHRASYDKTAAGYVDDAVKAAMEIMMPTLRRKVTVDGVLVAMAGAQHGEQPNA